MREHKERASHNPWFLMVFSQQPSCERDRNSIPDTFLPASCDVDRKPSCKGNQSLTFPYEITPESFLVERDFHWREVCGRNKKANITFPGECLHFHVVDMKNLGSPWQLPSSSTKCNRTSQTQGRSDQENLIAPSWISLSTWKVKLIGGKSNGRSSFWFPRKRPSCLSILVRRRSF